MAGQSSIQARIDADLKEELVNKCRDLKVKQVEVLIAGIEAFVAYGKWWVEDEEAEEGEEEHIDGNDSFD